ncbi:MAG TPA: O-antigen ligase family protein [Kiritimatiellia bacterium]|nr:O-antigen ligase family protein [Kiritimatiellia bacterium]
MPRSRSLYDWTALALLASGPLLGIWAFGSAPLWAAGPFLGLTLLGAALYLLRPLFFRPAGGMRCPPALPGLALFLLYGALSIPRAAYAFDAGIELMKLAGLALAYQAWSGLAGEQNRWRWLLGFILLSITLMAWYSIILHAQDSRMVLTVERPPQYEMRASGAYICPNHFANLLVMVIPMCLALVVMPAAGGPLRLLAAYALLVVLPPLYWSGSRSAWLGLIAGISVTVALLGLRRGAGRALLLLVVAPLVMGLAGVAAWMLSPLIQERVADALQGNVRINLWRDTLAMIADKPWFGFGPGSYRWVYPHYWHHLKVYLDPEFAHNDYLQLAAEFGLAGAILLLGVLGWALLRLVRMIRFGDAERGDFLIAGFVGACAACAIHAGFDYNFHVYGNVLTLAALGGITAGILFAGGHLSGPGWIERCPRWTSAFALVPVLLLALSARAVASHVVTLRGDLLRESTAPDAAITAYRKALRIAPENGAAQRGIGQVLAAQAMWNLDRETKERQVEEAMTAFAAARALNPWDLASLYGVSRLQQSAGNSERALASLRELAERAPHHRDYLVALGLQLRSMQRYAEALDVFERARGMGHTEQIELNIQFLRRRLASG